MMPPGPTEAMLPPPAPMVWMSIMGTDIFHPASNFSVLRCGSPFSISEMSVLVPPMAKAMMSDAPTNRLRSAGTFTTTPGGPPSPELERRVNKLRFEPSMKGKYVVVCTKPHAEWTLAQLPGARGKPIVMHHDRVFTSLDDAERAIFKLRWEAATGETLASETLASETLD